jgi:hypothetical protein
MRLTVLNSLRWATVVLMAWATVPAAETRDVLDAYVARLRADAAGPRRETGFLSAGSDFLYGQEYFEAGNYGAAERSFRNVVRKDERNAFAHYQLAVAMLQQGDATKRGEAQTHADTAFRLEPALKERFPRDTSGRKNPSRSQGRNKKDRRRERRLCRRNRP